MNNLYVPGSVTAGLEPNEQIKRRIEESKTAIKNDLPKYEALVADMKKAAKDLEFVKYLTDSSFLNIVK